MSTGSADQSTAVQPGKIALIGHDFLAGGGEMGALMRAKDWTTSPLGSPDGWPQSLRTVISLLLTAKFPMFVAWGPELGFLYNDDYAPILGARHPQALGRRFRDIWSDIWSEISPLIDRALSGEASFHENMRLVMERKGYPEETYFTFSYSPVRDEAGGIGGMFCTCTETTDRILADRQQTFLLDLKSGLGTLVDPREVMAVASELLGRHLDAAQVGYGEVNATGEYVFIEQDWNDGRIPSVVGRHRIQDFGSSLTDLEQGRAVVIGDVAEDVRTSSPDALAAFSRVSVRAVLTVPLVKEGRFTALLFVHHPVPRRWSETDLRLVRDVAEHTWSAVQRARAERALRESDERLQLALQASEVVGTWDWDLKQDLIFADARFARLYSVDPEQAAIGAPPAEYTKMIHPDDYPGFLEALRRLFEEDDEFAQEYRLVQPDGSARWVLARGRLQRDEWGAPMRFPGTSVDITERKGIEEALRESRRRLDAVLNNASVAIFLMDDRQHCVYMNTAAEKLTGYTVAETQGRALHDVVHHTRLDGSHYPLEECPIDRALPEENQMQGEEVFVHKDGSFYPVAFTASPIRDEDAIAVGTIIEVRDISTEKRAQEHQQLLINELNHRVKNTLATVQSIASQTLRNASSLVEARESFEGRLLALSRAHNVLTRENWDGARMWEIVAEAVDPYSNSSEDRLHLDGPEVRLTPRMALALSMALQELATNAAKYGSFSSETGEIGVTWAVDRNSDPPRLHLRWEETGGPEVEPPARRGFGSRLIERSLAQDLDGEVRIFFLPTGVICTVDAPIA